MAWNERAVICALFPSAASHDCPGPSAPEGHRIAWTLLNAGFVEDGEPSICAFWSGNGTKEEENGVAPCEKGTLGLFVVFKLPLAWKAVMKEPEKRRLL